jgi:magnesium transporter
MIRRFDFDARALVPWDGDLRSAWLDVVAPTAEELERLSRATGLPLDFAIHALDEGELARLDRMGDATLAVIEIPHKTDPAARVPFRSVPLGVAWRGDRVVTVGLTETDVVRRVVARFELGDARPERLLLRLLYSAAQGFLGDLRLIEARVEEAEERLESSLHNREVLELLRYQKALVYFTTALEQNELLVERLRSNALAPLSADDARLLEDVLVEVRQARDMTTVSMNILSETMDAFASIISNNLNVVMKVLTSLTLVLTLPSLVVGAWGMNVRVPLGSHPLAFAAVLGGALSLSIALLVAFRRLRWL